LQLIAIHL